MYINSETAFKELEKLITRTDLIGSEKEKSKAISNGELPGIIEQHLKGINRIGFYTTMPDNTAKWNVLDFDLKGSSHKSGFDSYDEMLQAMREIYRFSIDLKLNPVIEISKSGCFHLWYLFEGFVSADLIFNAFNGILTEFGLNGKVEQFPKQANVSKTGKGVGNFIWLPFFGNSVMQGKTILIDPNTLEPNKVQNFDISESSLLNKIIEDYPVEKDEGNFKLDPIPSSELYKRDGIDVVIEKCPFLQFWYNKQNETSEDLWEAGISILKFFKGGYELIHKVSSTYRTEKHRYSKSSTDRKIERTGAPYKCETIEKYGFDCSICENYRKIYSPVSLMKDVTEISIEQVEESLLDDDKKDLSNLETSDAGNAKAIIYLFGDKLKYDHKRKKWLNWNGNYWCIDEDGEIDRIALKTQKERLKLALQVKNRDQRNTQLSWAMKSDSRQKIVAAIEMLRSMHPVATTIENFDKDQFLLGCENGVVDLKTGKFRAGIPAEMISLNTHIVFDPEAKCKRWEQFLQEIFDNNFELIDFMKRAIGYSLTGSTEEQCLFLLYGTGSNGKTVLVETLKKLLGDYSFAAGVQTFEISRYDSQKMPNDIAALKSKRLVTASEVRENTRFNEARIKSLTGGDTLNARFLYGEYFNFIPTHKIWLSVNHKPNVGDASFAFWRRIRLIPFERTFTKDTGEDKKLKEKLFAELPGILNWAVDGCLQWQMEGLTAPEKVEKATECYKQETDIINQFLEENTSQGSDKKVLSSELYNAYKDYCLVNGEKAMSNNLFGRKLSVMNFSRDNDPVTRKIIYRGIGLINEKIESI